MLFTDHQLIEFFVDELAQCKIEGAPARDEAILEMRQALDEGCEEAKQMMTVLRGFAKRMYDEGRNSVLN